MERGPQLCVEPDQRRGWRTLLDLLTLGSPKSRSLRDGFTSVAVLSMRDGTSQSHFRPALGDSYSFSERGFGDQVMDVRLGMIRPNKR